MSVLLGVVVVNVLRKWFVLFNIHVCNPLPGFIGFENVVTCNVKKCVVLRIKQMGKATKPIFNKFENFNQLLNFIMNEVSGGIC